LVVVGNRRRKAHVIFAVEAAEQSEGSRERQLKVRPELVHHLHPRLDEILVGSDIARSALVSG
jgi:hypothetical protein